MCPLLLNKDSFQAALGLHSSGETAAAAAAAAVSAAGRHEVAKCQEMVDIHFKRIMEEYESMEGVVLSPVGPLGVFYIRDAGGETHA